MFKLTGVVKHLLIINVLMFLASMVMENMTNTNILALYFPTSEKFLPLQIVTHFFMHANFMHLFFNMFALVMFGSALEALWGPKRFLFYYFFCAFGAAIIHTLYMYYDISSLQTAIEVFKAQPSYDTFWAFFNDVPFKMLNPEYKDAVDELSKYILKSTDPNVVSQSAYLMQQYVDLQINIPIVGASGAVYGLLLAFGMQFPNAELMLIFLPIPIKAKYFIPFLMIAELYLGVNQFSWDNIAHFAHLGGAISGILLILYWRKFGSNYQQ